MADATQNRRKDTQLRAAVERVLGNIHKTGNKIELYQQILKELCSLSLSAFGFVLETRIAREGQLELSCVEYYFADTAKSNNLSASACQNITINSDTRSLFTALNNSQPIRLDQNALRNLDRLNQLWPTLHQVLLIPLQADTGNIRAICLANSEEPLHVDFARRVWPLVTVCNSISRILDNKNRHTMDEKRLLLDKDSWRDSFSQLELLAPLGIVTVNDTLEVMRINPAAEQLFGLKSGQVVKQSIAKLIPERFKNEHQTYTFTPSAYNRTPDAAISAVGQKANGELIPLEITTLRFREYGQSRMLLMMRDSSDLHHAQAKQRMELQRFRALADLAPMGILQTNREWHTEYANDRWLSVTGSAERDIQGLDWGKAIYHEDGERILTQLHDSLIRGKEFHGDCRIESAKEGIKWVQLHARPLHDGKGNADGFLATLIDNSYYHDTEKKLRQMAERDDLTGLANRLLFMDRLEHALTRLKRHGSLALLALDLDGFKNVNDSLGHDAGDQLLVEVSRRLTGCVRQEDTVSRVGGDEFIILLEDLKDASAAASIAEKILLALEKPMQMGLQEVFTSTSIGICFAVAGHKSSAKTLLKQADMALYRAKDAGRNNYQYYSPDLEHESRRRLELGNSLHHALTRAEFEMFYQLQADVQTGEVKGFEALLRWQHPLRGLLPPTEFIPLLEETGLIVTVTRWILHTSLHHLKHWIESGLVPEDAVMAVNISPYQFKDPLTLPSIKGALRDAELKGSNLVVEITETALMQDNNQTLECLSEIRKLGVAIALDDFGTGYSSLSYLKKYPIDKIKIDRSFVEDVLSDKEDAAITQAVLALAKSLQMDVVAEGVSSVGILSKLKEWGCEYYQGYLLNQPLGKTAIEQLLSERRQVDQVFPVVPLEVSAKSTDAN
ncbi:MAG: EAL domain-containing protein [Ketobacter sp.]|nr:MAG: EAL domain-containing protein [Ketobacter sp.]